MKRQWVSRLTAVAIVAAVIGAGLGTTAARADCLYARVDVTTENGPPIHVVGDPDPCVTPTPWNHQVSYTDTTQHTGLMPDGGPNGADADLRLPGP